MFDLLARTLLYLALLNPAGSFAQSHHLNRNLPVSGLRNPVAEIEAAFRSGTRLNINRPGYWDSLYTSAHQYNLPLLECRILNRIGALYRLKNENQKGIEACTKGLAIAEQHGCKTEAIALIKTLEKLHASQVNRHKMLELAYKGLKLAEESGDQRSVIDFRSSIGMFYFRGREYDKALKHHLKCLQMSREIGYDFGISSALADITGNYLARKDSKRALHYLREQRNYLPMLGKTVYAVEILGSLAAAYINLGQYDSGSYYTNLAYTEARLTGNKKAISSTLTIVGGLHQSTGNMEQAEQAFKEALRLALESRFVEQLPLLYGSIGGFYSKTGNYREALNYWKLEILMKDCLNNETLRNIVTENEFAYRMEKKENANLLLQKELLIGSLKLRQNRYLVAGLTIALVLILIIAMLWRRQNNLRNAHKQLQMERKLLLAQMNPHFIFNSMNSIRQLVMDNENQKAELYLSRLARLIRGLLSSSTKESITISEETRMLHAYLDMESLRFGQSFSYSLVVDEHIDPAFTRIPHLMIQPLVENAIWHGLLPKTGDRHIEIRLMQNPGNTIRCTVNDNGVGREASGKKKNPEKEESLAFGFIMRRIALMKTPARNPGITFIDKKDSAGQSLGTTAILILPVLSPEKI